MGGDVIAGGLVQGHPRRGEVNMRRKSVPLRPFSSYSIFFYYFRLSYEREEGSEEESDSTHLEENKKIKGKERKKMKNKIKMK